MWSIFYGKRDLGWRVVEDLETPHLEKNVEIVIGMLLAIGQK